MQQQLTAPSPERIWEGFMEWQEKDRTNPNNKTMRSLNSIMLSYSSLDQSTGQYQLEVPRSVTQLWPQKITVQLINKQILDILTPDCMPPTKNIIIVTDGNNQDLKTALSIGVSI